MVSPELFFLVTVRHTLKRIGVDDIEVADYMAAVCADFGLDLLQVQARRRRRSRPRPPGIPAAAARPRVWSPASCLPRPRQRREQRHRRRRSTATSWVLAWSFPPTRWPGSSSTYRPSSASPTGESSPGAAGAALDPPPPGSLRLLGAGRVCRDGDRRRRGCPGGAISAQPAVRAAAAGRRSDHSERCLDARSLALAYSRPLEAVRAHRYAPADRDWSRGLRGEPAPGILVRCLW